MTPGPRVTGQGSSWQPVLTPCESGILASEVHKWEKTGWANVYCKKHLVFLICKKLENFTGGYKSLLYGKITFCCVGWINIIKMSFLI